MENPNPKCEWCLHEWHEGECWCYCQEATTYPEPEFCDKCGTDLSTVKAFVIIEESKIEFTAFDGVPIGVGDTYTECGECHGLGS